MLKGRTVLQVLSDPRQKRFFKSKDMRDLFTLGDEYANATETSEIFASVNGEVTATLAAEQAPLPELNHAEGALSFLIDSESNHQWQYSASQLRVSSEVFPTVVCPAVSYSLALYVACWKLFCSVLVAASGSACCDSQDCNSMQCMCQAHAQNDCHIHDQALILS